MDHGEPATRLEIRRFEPSDAAAVWALHHEALEGTGTHAGDGPWDDDVRDPDGHYLRAGGEFLVGLLAGEIVAIGALLPAGADVAEIRRMRVAPARQRRGLGTRMLHALERRARARGFVRLRLDTTERQQAARAFYAHHGYTETGRGRLGAFELVYFEKTLG